MIVRAKLSHVDWIAVDDLVCCKKKGQLLGDAGTGAAGLLRVWLAAASSSHGISKEV